MIHAPRPQQAAPGPGFRIVRRVVEAVLRHVAYGRGAELDLRLAAIVEDWFESVLESVSPAAGHAVVGLPPAELVHEPPAPQPLMRQHESIT